MLFGAKGEYNIDKKTQRSADDESILQNIFHSLFRIDHCRHGAPFLWVCEPTGGDRGVTDMKENMKYLLLALVILYLIAPDLLPGPVDDLLVLLLTAPKLMDETPYKK